MIGSFPLIIRPAFTLGGTGGGIAYNMEEFEEIVKSGLDASMTNQARAASMSLPRCCRTSPGKRKLRLACPSCPASLLPPAGTCATRGHIGLLRKRLHLQNLEAAAHNQRRSSTCSRLPPADPVWVALDVRSPSCSTCDPADTVPRCRC